MTMSLIHKLIKFCCLRNCLLLTAVAGVFLIQTLTFPAKAQENEFIGEKIVHLLQEPRHRTVHSQDGLFLLDVQVNPGDTSFAHIHDQAILLTYISAGSGPRDGSVSANIDYASTPHTHKVANEGPGLMRIIAFVNSGLAVSDSSSDEPSGMSSEPDIENPWFRSYRVELQAGEQTNIQTHDNNTVIVQGSDGLVLVTRADGVAAELDAPGDWTWRDPNSPFIVRNVGQTSVFVAINEGRQ